MKSRLLLLVLAVVTAGVLGWIFGRDEQPPPEPGLEVHVEVVDDAGAPLAKAQVQPRYRPGWQSVDGRGSVRLEGVVLRADDAPTPEAVAAAIDVRSPAHAPRHPPVVERRADGAWTARYVLHAFGTVRLRILETTLQGVKAWIDPDTATGAIESVGGVAIARPGQPAAWRVFSGAGTVEVRIEGSMGVAARSVRLEAPSPGFVREFGLAAEASKPIRGHVAPPGGSPDGEEITLPSLRGRIAVTEFAEDGREVGHRDVRVNDDGSFEVTYAGEGRYRLTPDLYFADVPPRRVRGGDVVTFNEVEPRPWLVLPPGPLTDVGLPTPRMRLLRRTSGGPASVPSWSLFSEDEGWMLSVPGPGRYRLEATRMGTDDAPPAAGAVETEVVGRGPHPARLVLEPQPAGTLVIRVKTPSDRGGADVDVEADGDRHATVLYAFGREATVHNVRAGPFTARVRPSDRTLATVFLSGDVAAGATVEVEAVCVEGGDLVLEGEGAGLVDDTRPRRFDWAAGDGPTGEAPGHVALVREAGTSRWRAVERLAPGRYRGTLTTESGGEPPPETEFAVQGGEATVVGIEVP